jgi:hypothetical protein
MFSDTIFVQQHYYWQHLSWWWLYANLEQQGDIARRTRCQQEESRERAHSVTGLVTVIFNCYEKSHTLSDSRPSHGLKSCRSRW